VFVFVAVMVIAADVVTGAVKIATAPSADGVSARLPTMRDVYVRCVPRLSVTDADGVFPDGASSENRTTSKELAGGVNDAVVADSDVPLDALFVATAGVEASMASATAPPYLSYRR
jgi:hypothetical protein